MMIQEKTKLFRRKLLKWQMKSQMNMNKSSKNFLLQLVLRNKILYRITKIKFLNRIIKTTGKKLIFNNKKPIIYDTTNFNAYDGDQQFKLSKEYRNKIYSWETPYILINKSDASHLLN